MTALDLNLLAALDALLTEGSVTGAAARLGLPAPVLASRCERTVRQVARSRSEIIYIYI